MQSNYPQTSSNHRSLTGLSVSIEATAIGDLPFSLSTSFAQVFPSPWIYPSRAQHTPRAY